MSKNYNWIKLFLSTLVFLAYDLLNINKLAFIALFILGELIMVVFDIVFRKKLKENWIITVWLYVLYNYIGIKILTSIG